jgi:hypothetical protein
MAEPRPYLEWLNQSPGKEEIENFRYAIKKSRPYGSENGCPEPLRNSDWKARCGTAVARKKVPDTFSSVQVYRTGADAVIQSDLLPKVRGFSALNARTHIEGKRNAIDAQSVRRLTDSWSSPLTAAYSRMLDHFH